MPGWSEGMWRSLCMSSGTSGFIPYKQYNRIPIAPRLYGQALAILLMTEYLTIRQPRAL